MRIIRTIDQLRKVIAITKKQGGRIGFVPTMGYFHEGHLELMRRAKKENDLCVVSIYVNPTQFGPKEDLARYPRDFKRDSTLAKKENVDILFFPSDNEIYPEGYSINIDVGRLGSVLCGSFRPGHFNGVATIVAKLLNIVAPDRMYLGQKDAQQVVVLQNLVRDLNVPAEIRVVATKREQDGLAMSSRNVYLSPEHRQQASVIYKSLAKALDRIKKGERSVYSILHAIRVQIAKTQGKIQYLSCVNSKTLEPLRTIKGDVLIATAVYYGKTRLIDNVIIKVK